MESYEPIERNPEIAGGEPIFRGTRVPARLLREYLELGHSVDEFIEQHPTVTRAQALAVLELGFATVLGRAPVA